MYPELCNHILTIEFVMLEVKPCDITHNSHIGKKVNDSHHFASVLTLEGVIIIGFAISPFDDVVQQLTSA